MITFLGIACFLVCLWILERIKTFVIRLADYPLSPDLSRRYRRQTIRLLYDAAAVITVCLAATYTTAWQASVELAKTREDHPVSVLITNPESQSESTTVSVVTPNGNLIEGDYLEWSMRLISGDSGTESGCVSSAGGSERYRTSVHAVPGIGGTRGSVRGVDAVSDVSAKPRGNGTCASIPAFVERLRDLISGRQASLRGVAVNSKGVKEL